jgi:hypothetical protein
MNGIGLMVLAAHPLVRVAGAVLYLGAAGACAGAAASTRARRRFWVGLAMLQALMAADAALGLRNLLADVGRGLFRAEGWYETRRWPQFVMSAAGVVLVAAVAGAIVWRLRRDGGVRGPQGRACEVAAIGTGLSLAVVVLTAVSLHGVEAALAWPGGWFNAGYALRGAGAVLAVAAALWFHIQGKNERGTGETGASRGNVQG